MTLQQTILAIIAQERVSVPQLHWMTCCRRWGRSTLYAAMRRLREAKLAVFAGKRAHRGRLANAWKGK